MLNKFWESMGSNVAERWLDYIFSPAFLFWAGGFGLYVWKTGWYEVLQDIQTLSPHQQGSWLVLALIVLVISSVLMQAIRFPILRLLEGYWPWPLNYIGLGIVAMQKPFFQKKYDELRRLASENPKKLDAKQREKLIKLDTWAHLHPVRAKDLLPTPLGNILRARERSPKRKYGLDAIVCWPRLWPLLPENVRTDLAYARTSLDRLAELCFWGLLFTLWAFLTPWAILIGLLWMLMTHAMACQSAMAYGDLLESAFDLYRFLLYDAVGWPRPKNAQGEKELGAQLTEYLWRGTSPKIITYQSKENYPKT
jgi:hypothetical protein